MKLVDVTKYGFMAEPRYYFFGWTREPRVMGQEAVLKILVLARNKLPKGHNFKIWDMARPRYVQLNMIKAFTRKLQSQHPKASVSEIKKLVNLFAAKPLIKVVLPDTHRNGGALDLTIIDSDGQELYMGTNHDDLTERAATNYFERKKKLKFIDKTARDNRRLLMQVLTEQGFENYDPEWWHWSRVA